MGFAGSAVRHCPWPPSEHSLVPNMFRALSGTVGKGTSLRSGRLPATLQGDPRVGTAARGSQPGHKKAGRVPAERSGDTPESTLHPRGPAA